MGIESSETLEKDELDWLLTRGFPTFDEFRKNPDKWRLRPEQLFESADASTQVPHFRKLVSTQKWQWKDQFKCDSLEQIERIAKEEGFQVQDLEMEPLVNRIHGTSADNQVEIVVRFWPKSEFKARGGVVAND